MAQKLSDDLSAFWVWLRLLMALTFLWAFFDKLLGLGYSTPVGKGWLAGASPTAGFLKGATYGPFVHIYQSLAGQAWVDWLFMVGLLLIGLALLLGIGLKIAGWTGALLMLLMYLAAFPPKTNPLIDDHIVYIVILLALTHAPDDHDWGWGSWWSKTTLVRRFGWLR